MDCRHRRKTINLSKSTGARQGLEIIFFSLAFPSALDPGDLGRPTRYCYLESIYHAWDGGTDHRASLVSHPTQCVAVLGGLH